MAFLAVSQAVLRCGRLCILTALLCSFIQACRAPARQLNSEDIIQGKTVELEHDQILKGVLPQGQTRIVVRLTVAEPQMVRAELAGVEGSDLRLAIFQNSDVPLVVVDDRPEGLGEELPPVLVAAGEARIEISAEATKPGPLNFFFRRFRAPADIEREPNQTTAIATPMPSLHASGFYGPDKNIAGKDFMQERDCFAHTPPVGAAAFMNAKLTGVDGIQSALFVYGADGSTVLATKTGIAGKVLQIPAIRISNLEKVYLCVTGTRTSETVSRDYYDLLLEYVSTQNRREVEPNDTAANATDVSQGVMSGSLSDSRDFDYFSYQNQREYPVLVRAALEGEQVAAMRLVLMQRDGNVTKFESSAPKSEIIENARLESGETLVVAVQAKRTAKKLFKAAAPYELKISESQFSDENEAEPNGTVQRADSLIDATYKWGFINPPQDIDYYRLQLDETLRRQLRVESKLTCKLSLEHLRGGKIVKVVRAKAPLVYLADFARDDMLRLACNDLVLQPADRAYRIALSEP